MVTYRKLAILLVVSACARDGAGPPRQPASQTPSAETASVRQEVTLKVLGMT